MKRLITAFALLTTIFASAACSPEYIIKGTITAPSASDPHSLDGNITNNDCGAKNCKDAH